ncbi:MAG: hypothetical protein EHM20_04430 [Alphaproteobacteria bacterium]|nr:MAG: hypothetical protein EHM20_04430 [Alphaproteobacteria bacterium]
MLKFNEDDPDKINWSVLTPRSVFEAANVYAREGKSNEDFLRVLRYTDDNNKFLHLSDIYSIYKHWIKVCVRGEKIEFTDKVLSPKDLFENLRAKMVRRYTNFDSKRIWYNIEFTPDFIEEVISKKICVKFPEKRERLKYILNNCIEEF